MKSRDEQIKECATELVRTLQKEGLVDMSITVGHVIDNPTFMFDGWFEITTTDDDGTVHTLYDSYENIDKEIDAELLIEPITYMVVNKSKGRLRIEVR